MAKNRNKKTRNSSAMEITVESVSDVPQGILFTPLIEKSSTFCLVPEKKIEQENNENNSKNT